MSNLRHQAWGSNQDFLQEFSRLFERAGTNDASSGATADWAPAVDIVEHGDRFVIRADVPGVDPGAIEVTMEKGILSLSGSRELPVDQDGVERRRSERATGRFHRRFVLPDTIDAEAISASGKNGVLEIVIPKRAVAQPRRITVAA